MINYEKLAELFGKDEFAAKVAKCDTMEGFRAVFNEYGMEMDLDETAEVVGKIAELQDAMDKGELCDTELDEVAGGGGGCSSFFSSLTAFLHVSTYSSSCGARQALVSFRLFRRTVSY